MRKYIKIFSKFLLVGGFCLLSFDVFASNTKQMINQILAKYGISSEGKKVCGTDEEPKYDENTKTVRCYDNNGYYKQNCWDATSRSCKPCPDYSVVNKRNYIYCHKIICPEGFRLVKIQNNDSCPNGFKAQKITNNNPCPNYTSSYNEVTATNNYNSSSYNCKNINK